MAARIRIAIVALLLFAAYRVPISDLIVYRWWNDANWSHGWLVPFFSLYFLTTLRAKISRVEVRPSWWGLGLLLAALTSYFWFLIILPVGYPRALSIVPAILGVTLLLGGWGILRTVWFSILYLVLAIPLPGGLYFSITFPLRLISTKVASVLTAWITGAHTETSGAVIDYLYNGQEGQLNVEEACSGMRLMMAFFALGLAMSYLGERPAWQRVVLALSCIPIAIICNVIRVTMTGCIHIFEYESWAKGTPHELLGLAMLPIAFGLFALVGFVLKNLVVEEEDQA